MKGAEQVDSNNKPRGRPPRARERVLVEIKDAIKAGGPVPTLSSLARRCGLYDYRNARRVLRDLRRMEMV